MTFKDVIEQYQGRLRQAMSGVKIMYAYAYNDGRQDVGLRKYGSPTQHVQDVPIDEVDWLIAGTIYEIEGRSRQLHSCHEIEAADVSNLVLQLRAQGMVDGEFYMIPLGVYTVADREVVNSEFGVLTLR